MGAVYVGAPDQIFRTSANNQAPFANFSARTPVHSHVRLPAPHAHAAVRSSTSASRAVYTHASCAKGVSRTIFDAYPLPKYASFRTLTRASKRIDVKLFLHARMRYNPRIRHRAQRKALITVRLDGISLPSPRFTLFRCVVPVEQTLPQRDARLPQTLNS